MSRKDGGLGRVRKGEKVTAAGWRGRRDWPEAGRVLVTRAACVSG